MKLLFLIIFIYLMPLTVFAQDPESQELQQYDFLQEMANEIYGEVSEQLEPERERRNGFSDEEEEEEEPETVKIKDAPVFTSPTPLPQKR